MKNRSKQKTQDAASAEPGVAALTATPDVISSSEPCSPHVLLEQAMQEPNRRPLREYHDTIQVLRDEKRFTFREIADWLSNYNVEADHNAVYREYTRHMPDAVADDVAQEDAHMEEED